MLVTSKLISVKKATYLFSLSLLLWLAPFAVASAEVITSFDADYEVRGDGLVVVTETIKYDFEGASRHGIFRKIKNTHPQPASAWYKDRYVDIKLLSVTRDGQSEPYTLESYEGLSVKIGDADRTITGPHTYKIVYQLEGALAEYLGEGTELYWNVTGNEWPVAIQKVTASIQAGSGVELAPVQACYAGAMGVSRSCGNMQLNRNIAVFSQDNVLPGQGLTIAQRLTIPVPIKVLEATNYYIFWIIGVLMWFVGLGIWIYRWRVQHRPSTTIIPQYEPLPDFKPMFTGVLFDNRLDSRDISAGIVYLAQKGFISIEQTTDKILWLFNSTDYKVTLLRSTSETETALQNQIILLLFGYLPAPGAVIRLSEISKDSSKQRTNYRLMQEMKQAAVNEMVELGFFEKRLSHAVYTMSVPVIIFVTAAILERFGVLDINVNLVLIAVMVSISVVLILLFSTDRRTTKGFEALNYLKGFKEFLSVTEKERYKFHNAPALNPQQFMEYLPYAIAFGVETEWAEVFRDIQIGNPDWYRSSSRTNFDAASFTNNLGSFSKAFAGSSGSSGSSGSGGGGSSGGGGGGGGGGSW